MGSMLSCFSNQSPEPSLARKPRRSQPPTRRRGSSLRLNESEAAAIHEMAEAAASAILQQQQRNSVDGTGFDRSSSMRFQRKREKGEGLVRSSSTRPREAGDVVVKPAQLVHQDIKTEELETKRIVLVHGGGFGAWCWYKTIALLEDSNFKVNAVDLTGSGIHSFDSNKIKSMSQYIKPLSDLLESLPQDQKVILVGHDFGGACISHAMEMFPDKISKAVFLCASMLTNGQTTLDLFSQQMGNNGLLQRAQVFLYSNGKDNPPTAITLDKALINDLLFNQSSSKDVSLASVSMRPIPFAPVLEKIVLTGDKYGTVRRFYVEATEDNAIPLSVQQKMCENNPPEKVFRLKGSDHSPFFSKPQALHKILVEIAKMPALEKVEQ